MQLYTLVYTNLERGEIPHICGVFTTFNRLKLHIDTIAMVDRNMYYVYKTVLDEYIPFDTSIQYNNPAVYQTVDGVSIMYNDNTTY
jgi:hypothetical protein